MISTKSALLVLALFILSTYAGLTIHVQNPWRDEAQYNKELRIYGIAELNWDPGSAKKMTPEGNDWYKITINNLGKYDTRMLRVVRHKGNSWTYDTKDIGSLETLFKGSENSEIDVWVTFKDKGSAAEIHLDPLDAGATVIHFLNPWPEVSPKMTIAGMTTQMYLDMDHNGWYKGFFLGDRATLELSFEEYFGSSFYNSVGKTDTKTEPAIDLSAFKDSGQILYIWPDPRPVGPPKIATKFPGILGDAPFRTITAIVRDQKADGIEFEMSEGNDNVITGMVEDQLVDGKIKKGSVTYKSDNLEQWFETKIIKTDVTNDTCIDIEMRKTNNGGWEFNSDWYGGFYPIDDFNPYEDALLTGEDGKKHNFHFTMELHTQFDYHEGKKQIFSFTGDDDVWVFINGKLAIDLGAPHPPKSGSVQLDDVKDEFGLENGKTYNLDMFYCERRTEGSNFKMNTTFNLRNNYSLLYDSVVVDGATKFDIKELVSSGDFQEECGFNIYDSLDYDTVKANVEFLITGPYFNEADTLKEGTNFGGIVIEGDTAVSIDTSKITDLTNGEYTISFISKHNKALSGYITFILHRLEKAVISADTTGTMLTVGDTTTFSTLTLPVNLKADSTCTIYYEIDDSASGTFDEKGTVTLDGDTITIKAWAISEENNFLPSDTVMWHFIRELPLLTIIADPGDGTEFISDTSVTLTVVNQNGDTINDAKVYYLLDSAGSANYPDSNSGILYSGDIFIDTSLTIWAVAYHDEFVEGKGKWKYEIDLAASWVKLKTDYQSETNGGTIYFGKEVYYTLETNCDSLKYTDDGSAAQSGTKYTGAKLNIGAGSDDTVKINTYAFGQGFEAAQYTFSLVRDTLPPLKADTSAEPHVAFDGTLYVTLDLSKEAEENRWKAVEIYYTTDGTTPDSSKELYDGPIKVNKTLTIKAIAYSINAIKSPVLSKKYIKVSRIRKASYSDADGNGRIETINFELSHEPEEKPDSILVTSPFDKSETVMITGSISLDGEKLTASFEDEQFSFEKESTEFDNAPLAKIFGDYFLPDAVEVSDSVAPVILSGLFTPGEIKTPITGNDIKRHKDTITVWYSEEIKIGNDESPYYVKGIDDNYSFELSSVQIDGNRLKAVVDKIDGGYPTIGDDEDSIRIDIASATSDLRGNQQKVEENRYAPLKVLEPRYELIVTPISPFNPDSAEEIPNAFIVEGLNVEKAQISIADFLMTIKDPEQIDGSMVIMDKVGNEILTLDSKDHSNERIGCYLADTPDRTRFIFYWSGQNSQGRKVGSGIYRAQFQLKLPDGTIEKRIKPIAVRRNKK